jgi:hypothetical protein
MRLIDADALKENAFGVYTQEYGNIDVVGCDAIDDAPTIEALPLPCKPHQIIYFIGVEFSKCSEYGEEYDDVSCSGCEVECDSKKTHKVFTTRAEDLRWILSRYFDFGKTYFTTREAAEAIVETKK